MNVNTQRVRKALVDLASRAIDTEPLTNEDFREICESVLVSKMYYDMDVGVNRYINPVTKQLIVSENIVDGKIMLYDNGEKTDLVMKYTYYYNDIEYVHAYIEFRPGIKKSDLDLLMYQFMANQIFIIVSRQNLRVMLDFEEAYDDRTCIPNSRHLKNKYARVTKHYPKEDICVIFLNLQNFKYLNEIIGMKGGDEALVKYAVTLHSFIADEDECACRVGGDNFALFVKKENMERTLKFLEAVKLDDLPHLKGREYALSAWIGISPPEDCEAPIDLRLEHASIACSLGKQRFKKKIMVYNSELANNFKHGREIVAMFHPAAKNHEFHPFFQPKVNMLTGELIGFEALCRWIHDGKFIYPDQFIPVLDRQGLIHELDMTILNETCIAIKKWLDMGLEPPRVSVNISRKNLFIPNIEEEIIGIILRNGIDTKHLEVEITESAKEEEFDRLIDFLAKLKNQGLRISIDDFGTGYSSLSLINNINADIVKIDKSFVSSMLNDRKAAVLIETIIQIAKRLDMDIIAEGVEIADEGKALIKLGCVNAQGYYYSKPVDFETTTKLIREHGFKPIQ